MKKWLIAGVVMLALGLALGVVKTLLAEPARSGPQVGDKVPGPFRPYHLTGPDAGQRVCLYCKYGANPVAMVFVRSLSPSVVNLLKQLDAATAAHADDHMGSFAVFLSESKELAKSLQEMAGKEHIDRTVLTMHQPAPERYEIAAEADVTVILYSHHVVKANYAFRAGELDDKAITAVIADVAKIVAPE